MANRHSGSGGIESQGKETWTLESVLKQGPLPHVRRSTYQS